MQKIYVYYTVLPEAMGAAKLYPKERMDEINGCKNERVRREKYGAWELLKYAVKDSLNLEFDNLNFTKLPSGQWVCDGCCFSISHSLNALVVAVSDGDVGVDVEALYDIDERIAQKVMSDREYSHYNTLEYGEKEKYLLELWCKKEAIFKALHRDAFIPHTIETGEHFTHIQYITVKNWEYLISVCVPEEFSVEIKAMK